MKVKSGNGKLEFGVLRKPIGGWLVATDMLDDAMKDRFCCVVLVGSRLGYWISC